MLGGHYSLTGSKNIKCIFSLVLHSLTTRSQVSVMSLMLLWGHASKIAYHPGISQTLRLLHQHFWSICRQTWELMAVINSQPVSLTHLQSLLVPGPILYWTLSQGFPLPRGYSFTLNIIDHFSKAPHFIPLSKLPTKETANPHNAYRYHLGWRSSVHLSGLESMLQCFRCHSEPFI